MKKFISIFAFGTHALKTTITLKNICSLHLLLDFLVKLEHICQISSAVSKAHSPWTAAHQAPLSMGFYRQEYWGGLPFPPPGDLPHPGIESVFLCLRHWQAGSLLLT